MTTIKQRVRHGLLIAILVRFLIENADTQVLRVELHGLSTVLYSYGGLRESTEVTVRGDCSRTR